MDRLIILLYGCLGLFATASSQTALSDSISGHEWHQQGNLLWDQDNLPAADSAFRQALELRKRAGDTDGFLVSATNLGILNQSLDNLPAARFYLQQVIDQGPNRKQGQAYYQLARTFDRSGEIILADQAYQAAAKLPPFSHDVEDLCYLYLQWGAVFLIDRPDQAWRADSLLNIAYQLTDELGEGAAYANTVALTRIGLAKIYSGQLTEAIDLLEQSLHINRQCCQDQDLEVTQLTNLGIAYRRQGAYQKALECLMGSRAINESLSEGLPDAYLANDFDNLSTYYLETHPDSAYQYAQLAIEALLPHLGSLDDFGLPQVEDFNRTTEWPALLTYISDWANASQVLAAQTGKASAYAECLDIYRAGDELIRFLYGKHEQVQTQLIWRAEARNLYAYAISAALSADQPELAFYYSERARAQLLLDEQLKARAGAALPPKDYASLLQARARANWVRNSEAEAENILEASRALEQLQDSLFVAYPNYAQVREVGLPDLDFDLSQIPKNWTVVEYFYEPAIGFWSFIFEDGNLRTVELKVEALPDLVNRYRQALLDFRTPFSSEIAAGLYDVIWAPLDIETTEKLIIVPDGILSELPFEAMITDGASDDEPGAYRSMQWWHERHQASYAYSLRWLLEQDSPESLDERLFFGPMSEIDPESGLDPSLPLTASLADGLEAQFGFETLLGKEANRENLTNRLGRLGLFQLSSHAFPSAFDRAGASFLLSDSKQPHFFDYELLSHRLRADLVVLAGCNTEQGLNQPGEGVASLGRSFASAGARSLVSSRWPIDESATATLLKSFYAHLADGKTKPQAIAAARSDYLDEQLNNDRAHPYFWAGLAYIGAPEGIPPAEVYSYWPLILVFLLFLSLVLIIIRRFKTRNEF